MQVAGYAPDSFAESIPVSLSYGAWSQVKVLGIGWVLLQGLWG